MLKDSSGNTVAAESVLQFREAHLQNLHISDHRRAAESSDDEGDSGQMKTNKSK